MEDCKCGRIPPCYGGKKFRIHEELEKVKPCSEETAQGVIEALMKLENASELSEASNRLAEYIFEDILKSIKSNDMEKKKMTKAEAFEYLKHKKVAVTGDTIALQNKLFNIGYKWCDSSIVAMPMVDFLLIDDETFQFTESLSHFKNCAYEEISADDILSIKIVEEEEDTSMPTVEFERYVKILQAWSKRINSSFVFSERGMGIIHGDLLAKLEGEEKGAYYKVEATL